MSSLLELLPTSQYGFKGQKPTTFELGQNSTIHDTSSIDGNPAFGSYAYPDLRTKKPTLLSRGLKRLPHYLDNPPH